MMKLAICDDDIKTISRAEEVIAAYNRVSVLDSQFSPSSFTCPTTLRDEITDGQIFDAFILDIEMEMLDGFSLAREIRKYMPTAAIIFLSSHTEYNYTQEGYKVRALRYVSKLTMETSLMEALETAAKACQFPDIKYFTISHYNDILRIPYDEIIYIHRVSRTTEIVTENNDRPVIRMALKEVMDKLDDHRFVYTDRSCIVNGNFVVSVQKSALCLRNGETLPVSRKMMSQVKTDLLSLWGGLK